MRKFRQRINIEEVHSYDNIPDVQFEHLVSLYNSTKGWLTYVDANNIVLDKQCSSLDEFISLYDDVENNLMNIEDMYEGDDL